MQRRYTVQCALFAQGVQKKKHVCHFYNMREIHSVAVYNDDYNSLYSIQSCTQIIRPLARLYSYDYDLRKTNYIFE